jgi:Ubiquitin-2 like Rad60 SUMO-like
MQDFYIKRGGSPDAVRFYFDNRAIFDRDTADDLGMEDGDRVEVIQDQIGGGWSDPGWNLSHLEALLKALALGRRFFRILIQTSRIRDHGIQTLQSCSTYKC